MLCREDSVDRLLAEDILRLTPDPTLPPAIHQAAVWQLAELCSVLGTNFCCKDPQSAVMLGQWIDMRASFEIELEVNGNTYSCKQ